MPGHVWILNAKLFILICSSVEWNPMNMGAACLVTVGQSLSQYQKISPRNNKKLFMIFTNKTQDSYTVYDKMFEVENVCSFHGYPLIANALPLKISRFVTKTLKAVLSKPQKFSLHNEYCWWTAKVSPLNVLSYMIFQYLKSTTACVIPCVIHYL